MSQSNVNFRLDSNVTADMEAACKEMGLTMTAAFTIFATKVARERRIPFEVTAVNPNTETLSVIKEVEWMKADPTLGEAIPMLMR